LIWLIFGGTADLCPPQILPVCVFVFVVQIPKTPVIIGAARTENWTDAGLISR